MADYEDRPLIGYLPPILKEVRELKSIMDAEQPEIFDLFALITNVLNNQFITTATEYGVKRWEKILGIVPKATFTLDERKFTVLSRLNEQLPYTYPMLRQMLTQLCGENGFEIELLNDLYKLNVKVALIAKNNLYSVDAMLKRVIPANIVTDLSLLYNTWGVLKNFTWGQLKTKTWQKIKEEVL